MSRAPGYIREVVFEAPTVTTDSTSSIAATSAVSGGNVTSDGYKNVVDKGVCYSTTSGVTILDNKTSDGTGLGTFASSLTGLSSGIFYYVNAFATNSIGTAYGSETGFTTTWATGVWSAGGDYPYSISAVGAAGSQSFGVAMGGSNYLGKSNFYNGSTWVDELDMVVHRGLTIGIGSPAAGLAVGGVINGDDTALTSTEELNITWGTSGTLSTGRRNAAGAGTQSAGLVFGGQANPTPTYIATTEEYNGSAWSAGGNLLTATGRQAGCGTQTAALSFGFQTESYDGTSWSSENQMNIPRTYLAGCGTQSAGLSFGGSNSKKTTEEYNGVNWFSAGDMNNGRHSLGGFGSQDAAVGFCGSTNITEEYNS